MTATIATPGVEPSSTATGAPVVVGVLDMVASTSAVAWAAAEAAALRTSLTVLHAWSWPGLAPWHLKLDDAIVDDIRHGTDALLDDCERIAHDHGAAAVTVASVEGGRIEALVDAACDAAVLVVGSRHLGLIGRLLLGSTSTALSARATCPIVIADQTRSRGAGTVVIGIDPAHNDGRLLEYGFAYAQRHGLAVKVVTCWQRPMTARWGAAPPHEAHVRFSEYVSRWRDGYPDLPVTLSVRTEATHDVLVAESDNAELLVIGRRSDHAHLPLVFGAVSQAIVRDARCSVAIIPPHVDVDPARTG